MNAMLIVCLVLSIIDCVLKMVWYKRWNAKQDKGKKGINMWLTLIPMIASIFPCTRFANRSGFMCRLPPPHATICCHSGSGRVP